MEGDQGPERLKELWDQATFLYGTQPVFIGLDAQTRDWRSAISDQEPLLLLDKESAAAALDAIVKVQREDSAPPCTFVSGEPESPADQRLRYLCAFLDGSRVDARANVSASETSVADKPLPNLDLSTLIFANRVVAAGGDVQEVKRYRDLLDSKMADVLRQLKASVRGPSSETGAGDLQRMLPILSQYMLWSMEAVARQGAGLIESEIAVFRSAGVLYLGATGNRTTSLDELAQQRSAACNDLGLDDARCLATLPSNRPAELQLPILIARIWTVTAHQQRDAALSEIRKTAAVLPGRPGAQRIIDQFTTQIEHWNRHV